MFTVIVLGYLQPPHCSIHFSVQKNNNETAERLAAESEETLTVNIGLITPAAAPTVPPALPRSAPLTSYLGPPLPRVGHLSAQPACVQHVGAFLRTRRVCAACLGVVALTWLSANVLGQF